MKKLLILILVFGGAYLYFTSSSPEPEEKVVQEVNKSPDASNATFIIEGDSVALRDGINLEDSLETKLLPLKASGDLNFDTKNDTAVLLTQTGGGSGTFVYVAAYISGPVSYKSTNTIFLGDRISPQTISVSNGVIRVKYLDRKEDESFADEPTVEVTKELVVRDGALEEK